MPSFKVVSNTGTRSGAGRTLEFRALSLRVKGWGFKELRVDATFELSTSRFTVQVSELKF